MIAAFEFVSERMEEQLHALFLLELEGENPGMAISEQEEENTKV